MTVNRFSIQSIPSGISASLRSFLLSMKTYIEEAKPTELPSYTAEQLNATIAGQHSGELVRCSNGDTGDECLAFCDGFNWRVISIGDKVSSS